MSGESEIWTGDVPGDGERSFGAVFENPAIGVAVCTLKGQIIRANRAFARLTGYSVEEMVGAYCLELTHPDDVDRERSLMESLFAGEMEFYQLEKRILRADGRATWVLMTRSLVRAPGGAPHYGIAMVVDINDHKEAEAALREREEQLQRAYKLEAVGQLARGIAHDFNNLLMPVIGNATLLLADVPPDHPDADMLRDIKEAGERAAVLTKQILTFSRSQTLDVWPVQVNEVVTGIEPIIRGLLGEDVVVDFALAEGLREVRVDRHELEQVLVNLAVNARDAMPKGGKFTIETANVDLKGSDPAPVELVPGDYVMVTVSDTGVGMDKHTLKHAFEPFFTTKDVGKGTGLGLATVFGIAKQSGGAVSVYSEPGRGACFRVYLPANAAARLEPRAGKAPERLGEKRPMILLLEDEAKVRTLVGRVMRGAGYEVVEAGSGAELEETLAARAGTPDLLLTDVVLPGGRSGRQVADDLRERFPGIAVMYISGYSRESAVDSQFESGAAVLEKPFAPDVLLERVRAALGEE